MRLKSNHRKTNSYDLTQALANGGKKFKLNPESPSPNLTPNSSPKLCKCISNETFMYIAVLDYSILLLFY